MGLSSGLSSGEQSRDRLIRARLRNYFDKIDFEALRFRGRVRREIDCLRSGAAENGTRALPNFVIIGAPKCGTTWLAEALAGQPDLLIVKDEIEYFSSHLDQPLSWYLSHFKGLLAEHVELTRPPRLGEKSASYCVLSPARIGLMRRLLPDVQLILMIRDPVARHWAHAKRFFGKKKAKDHGFDSLESQAQVREFFIRTRRFSEFSSMVENWTDVYPSEQILIMAQEVARADPKKSLKRVLRHVGAEFGQDFDRDESTLNAVINEGPRVPMPDDVSRYLESMFAGERERLDRVLRARFPAEVLRELGR
jgi:hypothetical protein